MDTLIDEQTIFQHFASYIGSLWYASKHTIYTFDNTQPHNFHGHIQNVLGYDTAAIVSSYLACCDHEWGNAHICIELPASTVGYQRKR